MNARFIVKSLKGCAVGIAASLILTLVFGVIASKTKDPGALITILSHLARCGGAFVCGFSSARMNREKGLVCGFTGGALFSFVFLIATAFGGGDFPAALIACLVCVALSVLGGIIGVPKEKSGIAKRRALIRRKGL